MRSVRSACAPGLLLLLPLALGCANQATAISDGSLPADLRSSGGDADLATGSAADLSTKPVVGEPPELIGITAAHNQVRASAKPTPSPALPALEWSSAVATAAQAWADGCTFKHSGNGYGENIYANAGSNPTGQSVVDNWASEASNYTYSSNSCAGTCGHYTQVVWRGSTQLGCGFATCTKNSPFSGFPTWNLVVCDYNPPGNDGSRPY